MSPTEPKRWQKDKRLLKRAQYQLCYNLGEKHFTKLFVVFAKKAPQMKVGMAVSKKSGNAVARNRIKRVLREFFRLTQEKIPCVELVVVPKKHVRAQILSLSSVEKDLLPLLGKLRASESFQ